MLQQALHVLHASCGPMHVATAGCYSALASLHYHHYAQCAMALSLQQKGLLILEKIKGLDDAEVAWGTNVLTKLECRLLLTKQHGPRRCSGGLRDLCIQALPRLY